MASSVPRGRLQCCPGKHVKKQALSQDTVYAVKDMGSSSSNLASVQPRRASRSCITHVVDAITWGHMPRTLCPDEDTITAGQAADGLRHNFCA
eukprot:2509544-Pyramimonas_sp.AAC.1